MPRKKVTDVDQGTVFDRDPVWFTRRSRSKDDVGAVARVRILVHIARRRTLVRWCYALRARWIDAEHLRAAPIRRSQIPDGLGGSHDQPAARILEHTGQSLPGIIGIERHVGGARLEHCQNRNGQRKGTAQ